MKKALHRDVTKGHHLERDYKKQRELYIQLLEALEDSAILPDRANLVERLTNFYVDTAPGDIKKLAPHKVLNLLEKDGIVHTVRLLLENITMPFEVFVSEDKKKEYMDQELNTYTTDPNLIAYTNEIEKFIAMGEKLNLNPGMVTDIRRFYKHILHPYTRKPNYWVHDLEQQFTHYKTLNTQTA